MDVIGYGNDNTGNSLYEAGRGGIPLTNEWVFVVVPIPSPSRLVGEQGMFTFAEGLEQQPPESGIFPYPAGYSIYLDEIRFASSDNIDVFRQHAIGQPAVLCRLHRDRAKTPAPFSCWMEPSFRSSMHRAISTTSRRTLPWRR